MRITCEVDLGNRLLPSFNMKGKNKFVHAQLSIGRKPGTTNKESALFLMMCTAKDRNGTKYMIKDNVEQIFGKFVNEGKATIRFKEPPHDLCMRKADPLQLKGFLSVARMGAQGKDLSKITLSSLAPASAKQVEKPKSRMVILSRKDYPITTGFPRSLESLQISGCTMKRMDSRILNLKLLKRLDLSENSFTELPLEIADLGNLSELKVTKNHLTHFPPRLCMSGLQTRLTLLDLSGNKIKFLPSQFCLLVTLIDLKLDDNELVGFPSRFGSLKQLRFLSATRNQIKTLPATFSQLRLDSLDLYGNPFRDCDVTLTHQRLDCPTLLEFAARVVKKYRVPYTPEDLHPLLYKYMDSAKVCFCGQYCFDSVVQYETKMDLRDLAETVTALDITGRTHAPMDAYLCSIKCFNRLRSKQVPLRDLYGQN